jgi:hypothetical protein
MHDATLQLEESELAAVERFLELLLSPEPATADEARR